MKQVTQELQSSLHTVLQIIKFVLKTQEKSKWVIQKCIYIYKSVWRL